MPEVSPGPARLLLRPVPLEHPPRDELPLVHPVHDRHSHGADAFRYLALVVDQEQDSQMQRFATQAEGEFDVFSS